MKKFFYKIMVVVLAVGMMTPVWLNDLATATKVEASDVNHVYYATDASFQPPSAWKDYSTVKYTEGNQPGATATVDVSAEVSASPGSYKVYADWITWDTQTTKAVYQIEDGGKTVFTSAPINQKKLADQETFGSNGAYSGYYLLGSFMLTGSGTKVILSGESADNGNVVFDTVEIKHTNVALSAPVLTSPENNSYTNSATNISLNWTASSDSDENPALHVNYDVYVDGSTLAGSIGLSDPNYTLDVSAMSQGAHTWQVIADNGESSVAQSVVNNFIVDTISPDVTGVTSNQTYNDALTPVVSDINLNTATLNGVPFVSGTTISDNGDYQLIATDKAGNITTVNFIIDIPPTISGESTANVTTTSATITWTTDHASTSRVVYDTVSHSTVGAAPNYGYAHSTVENSALVTNHSVTVTGLAPGTVYYFRTISHGSPEAYGVEKSFKTSVEVVTAVAGPETPVAVVASPSIAPSVITPTPTETGEIKGTETTPETSEEESINWTPWIILFILIILAGAATGGYFYWFGKDEEEEIISTEMIEESRKKSETKKSEKKAPAKKKNRW